MPLYFDTKVFSMSCDLEPTSGWDRTFLDLSSKISEPFCSIWHLACYRLVAPLDPQKFENCTSRIKEVATRALICVAGTLLIAAFLMKPLLVVGSLLALGIMTKVLRAVGFAFQKNGYTYVKGSAPDIQLDPIKPKVKVMHINVCGVAGGLSLDHGGVSHWQYRLDALVAKIKQENPDALLLEEIYDTALAEALYEKLKADYGHFFMHLGANVIGSVGGCMMISRCPVHKFSNTSFKNNHWTLNRTFATLEIKASKEATVPCARIIGTHLIHGDSVEDQIKRQEQFTQIRQTLKDTLPTILMGDLNIERDKAEGKILSDHLDHAYTDQEPTCTNHLVAQWDQKARSVWGETIDYISSFKSMKGSASLSDARLVKMFDETYNTQTALSDHHGLSATLHL